MGYLNETGLARVVSKLKQRVQGEIEDAVIETLPASEVAIVQTTGSNTTAVMSQKAVTDALADFYTKSEVDSLAGMSTTEYTADDLTTGYHFVVKDVGAVAPTTAVAYAEQGCLRFAVAKGDIVVVASKGGYYGRAWVLTNSTRVVTAVSASYLDCTGSPVTLTVTEDGWFYTNCESTAYGLFSVTHSSSALRAEVSAVKTEVASVEADTEQLKKVMFTKTSYNNDNLQQQASGAGLFWYLSKGIGTQVSVSPNTHGTVNLWACLPRIAVSAGDYAVIATVGGGNARAWALTDASRHILSVAAAGAVTTSEPAMVEVEEDGYLYVNCDVSGSPDFSVVVYKKVNVVEHVVAHYKNNPLPLWKDTLKVLAIGNSFVADPLTYMPSFLTAAGIEPSKICFYGLVKSSCSLATWESIFEADDALSNHGATCSRYAGSISMGVGSSNTLAEILSQNWDVVTFQQVSTLSPEYASFNPHLTKLMRHVRELCPNQQVAFAWQSVWAYKSGYSGYGESAGRWSEICGATREMVRRDGIDIVIPTGTAVQNARNTATFAGHNGELTRDGKHLCYGAGRYIATATWFQTLVAPIFGVSVLGNTAVRSTADASSTYDFVAVDDSNREVLQRCALAATVDMWSITDDIDPVEDSESE